MDATSGDMAGSPAFRSRLWGYNRAQVDEFLSKTAADRQQLRDRLARLDLLLEKGQGPGATVGVAIAEAQDILAKAERQAHSVLRDAEYHAELLRAEQLAANQRELDRLTALRFQVACSLETSVAALRVTTGLLSDKAGGGPVRERLPSILKGATWAVAAQGAELFRSGARFTGRLNHTLAAGSIGCLLFALLLYRVGMLPALVAPAEIESRGVEAPIIAAATAISDTPLATPPAIDERVEQPASTASGVSAARLDSLNVTLTALRPCWVGAIIDGGQRTERMMKQGETLLLHAYDEVILRVGDASALSVILNDRPTKSLGGDGEVVTRRITKANLPTFVGNAF
jgi:uncharacterized protein DUF4115